MCAGTPANTQQLTYFAGNACWQGMGAAALQLPKWRLALAKVKEGAADAKLLVIGDSITNGWGTTNQLTAVYPASYPARLATILNGKFATAPGLAAVPSTTTGTRTDARWTVGSGWASYANYGFGAQSMEGTAGSGNLVFTPGGGVSYDSFTVYYTTYPSGVGTLTITATGGTPSVVSTIGSSGIGSVTVAAASAGTTNAVTITDAVNPAFVVAVEPFLSTTSRVRVGSAGVAGSTTTTWTADATAFGAVSAIKLYAPSLTVIMLGVNDATASAAPGTVTANLTTLAKAAQVSGDVIFAMWPPPSGSPTAAYTALYYPAIANLATSLAAPFVDVYGRWGSTWQTAFQYDSVHPNDYGHWDIAEAISALLLAVAP